MLNIVLTPGSEGARAGGVTVLYGNEKSALSVVGITNNPNMPSPSAVLPLITGNTIDTGTSVENLTAEAFPPFVRTGVMFPDSWVIGTVMFVTTAAGNLEILSSAAEIGDILDLNGNSISGISDFNSAKVNVVPEPGTVILLSLGLLGIALVGRTSS